ncbi:hypothetical protein L0F63_005460 [Massospora cicadina]|nr:hypothetical protein L0F63_005460 [Massospora cicadina]
MAEDLIATGGVGGSEILETGSVSNLVNGGSEPKRGKRSRGRKKAKPTSRAQELFGEFSKTEVQPDGVEVVYVPEVLEIEETDPLYDDFKEVFDRFSVPDPSEAKEPEKVTVGLAAPTGAPYRGLAYEYGFGNCDAESDTSDTSDAGEGANPGGLSRKKLRKLSRMSISELKQRSKKPEVVEWVDVTASDPTLLVHLKSYRNSVPIPKHWSQKRKYLQGKRGIEKPPFELPAFIRDTGIMEMRQAVKDKEDHARAKTKARERVQPRMGKLDTSITSTHTHTHAFFRFQTKPYLTKFGELYYEGKEFETKLKEKKPGVLSENLKAALNIPPLAPPPWLINMQRAMWGYHPGGWGKPPVDEFNRPLYGDVFGNDDYTVEDEVVDPIDRTLWGELLSEEEAVDRVEEEEEEEEEEPVETVVDMKEGLATPSDPQEIELRKDTRRPSGEPKKLYHVLPQKEASTKGQFMGSQYTYDTGAILGQEGEPKKRRKMDGVDVALDPNEVSSITDKSYLASKYEGAIQERNAEIAKEDLGDMVAEHAAEQERRRRSKTGKDAKDATKDKKKGFKF